MDQINKNLATLQLAMDADSDAEEFQETQSPAQEPDQGSDQDRAYSHQNNMALTKKNQEMKLTIDRLQRQIHQIQKQQHQTQEQHQQEVTTSRRLRHQRDQYRSTAKDLANQVIRLQLQHHQE